MQATLNGVRYGGVTVERVSGNVEYLDKRAAVAVDLARDGRTAVVARVSLPIELRYFDARLLDDSLRGSVRTDSASFDLIEAVVPGLRNATGRLNANLDLAGTWGHPDLTGALRVEDGEVTVDAVGIRMKGVNVDVALFGHRDSLAIRRLVGWSGATPNDSASLRGYIAYADLENPYLDLRLHSRTFHALDRRSLARLDVSTEPDGVRLRGNLRGATLTGGLIVDRGTIFLPDPALARKQLGDIGDVVDTSAAVQRILPAPPSKVLESILIDEVRVRLGDDVWLRSREANIKLGGSLNVQRSSRQRRGTILGVGTPTGADSLSLALDGELIAERGTYTLALGLVQREFQVENGGTITFFPTPELAPELNISALHTVHTANGEDLRIRVRLTGPLYPNPIVGLESAESFALSPSDAISYLIFGQPNFELGETGRSYVTLAAQTLFPTAQTIAAAGLRGVLGSWADIVQFRLGSADFNAQNRTQDNQENFTQILLTSRVGAEKQLSDRVFVSLSTGICSLRPNEAGSATASPLLDFYQGLSGRFEYRLAPDASLRVGKEPSAQICGRQAASRVVQTPSQFGLSLFKSWRF
jgi:translocation and assembly module TamB